MTPTDPLPPLPLSACRSTRDALHAYALPLGRISRDLSPPHPHWWHVSLSAGEGGLSTAALPGGPDGSFDLTLDLRQHALVFSSQGESRAIPLRGQSQATFTAEVLALLASYGVAVPLDQTLLDDTELGALDMEIVARYALVLDWVDGVLERFRAELPGKTSPVQLWPHHFDIAMSWFSGRKAPGVDPADPAQADESMTFGFSTGDAGIPNPYFYILAYPWPEAIRQSPLPAGAVWQGDGWQGGLMPYDHVREADDPEACLLAFLRAGYAAGAPLMR